jgi:hypothetical protein
VVPELVEGRISVHDQIGKRYTIKNMSGIIGKKQIITPDLCHRIVKGYELISEYGPPWKDIGANLYFMTHENDGSLTIHWPGNTWGLEAPPDVNPKKELLEIYEMVEFPQNPSRETVWSGLYYDSIADDWMVSGVSPIDIDGQHIASVGIDVLLTDLFKRALGDHLEGAYNVSYL